MDVIVNIKQGTDIPARQRKAWDEFLRMLIERAEAEIKKSEELAAID